MENQARLCRQIEQLAAGTLAADELAVLQQTLRTNSSARKLLLDYFTVASQLSWIYREPRPSDLAASLGITAAGDDFKREACAAGPGTKATGDEPKRGQPDKTAKPPASPVLGFLGGVIDYVNNSRTLLVWLICVSLVGYFTMLLGSLLLSRLGLQNPPQIADAPKAAPHSTAPADGPRNQAASHERKVVAQLSSAIDCQWVSGAAGQTVQLLPLGSELLAGQRLQLKTGVAELTFQSGAKIVLQGPSQFTLAGPLAGDLLLGELTAKVPHTAAGFTVGTPGGKVIDLGTEFGVKVLPDRTTNVVVYVGEVEVESGGGDGGASAGDAKAVKLKAGKAISVAPDKSVKPIPPDNDRLIRNVPQPAPKADAEAAYVELMKRLRPVVWLRMEGKGTDRALHDEMGGPDAKLFWSGADSPFSDGRIGKGLVLRGPKVKDCAILPDYPKADRGRLSVVAWAYADSCLTWSMIAANWGQTVHGQFHFGLCHNGRSADEDLGVLIRQASGPEVLLREGQPFPLNQWQHVAFTADGTTLRIYRQAKEVARAKINGLAQDSTMKALAIGMQANDEGTEPAPKLLHYWSGKLDELAVFNDTLSADDIAKLAATAPR